MNGAVEVFAEPSEGAIPGKRKATYTCVSSAGEKMRGADNLCDVELIVSFETPPVRCLISVTFNVALDEAG